MSLLKFLRKCSESVRFDDNNDLQEDLKIFKSDAFENYKSFVPVEVQSSWSQKSVLEITGTIFSHPWGQLK